MNKELGIAGTWRDAKGNPVHTPTLASEVIHGTAHLDEAMTKIQTEVSDLTLKSLAQMSEVDRRLADHFQTFMRVFS